MLIGGKLLTEMMRLLRLGVPLREGVELRAFSISWSNWSNFIINKTMESKRDLSFSLSSREVCDEKNSFISLLSDYVSEL